MKSLIVTRMLTVFFKLQSRNQQNQCRFMGGYFSILFWEIQGGGVKIGKTNDQLQHSILSQRCLLYKVLLTFFGALPTYKK